MSGEKRRVWYKHTNKFVKHKTWYEYFWNSLQQDIFGCPATLAFFSIDSRD